MVVGSGICKRDPIGRRPSVRYDQIEQARDLIIVVDPQPQRWGRRTAIRKKPSGMHTNQIFGKDDLTGGQDDPSEH